MEEGRAYLLAHTACVDFHSAVTLAPNQRPVDYKVPPGLSSLPTHASAIGPDQRPKRIYRRTGNGERDGFLPAQVS